MVQTNFFLTRQASTRSPGQKLVEPCQVQYVLTTSLWVQQTCQQACTRLWGQPLFEPTWSKQLLTWLACTSWPGQQLVEPTWFRLVQTVFDPASLYNLWQVCASLPGQKLVEPCRLKSVLTTSLWVQQTCRQACTRLWGHTYVNQLGLKTVDPASLYKLAGSTGC